MGRSKYIALALFFVSLAWGCGASDDTSSNGGGNGGSSTVDAGGDFRPAPGDLGGTDEGASEVAPIDGEDCTNTLDDDGDGQVDCGDSDCIGHEACGGGDFEVTCDDELDDDGDGRIDCDDDDCATAPNCDEPVVTGPEICTGGVDEDGDTLIDCNDGDCSEDPACAATTAEDCFNSIDDDGDGLRDCEDPDCERACGGGTSGGDGGEMDMICMVICMMDPSGMGMCDCGGGGGGGEDCTNGSDDNGDGAVDCDDLLCMMDPACM